MEQTLAVSSSLASRRRNFVRTHPYQTALFVVAVCAVVFAVAIPSPAHAEGIIASIFNIGYSIIAKIVFGLAYLVSIVLGLFIGIAAFLVGIMLSLNTQAATNAFVTAGFDVTLSIANLGFVIGMIVMAIMTIIRYQPYGVKQMLWRIVVMAILVNFGLVIAGSILGLANSLTAYFLDSTTPAGASGPHNFATALAGAFNPQAGFTITEQNFDSGNAFANTGAGIAKFFQPIASLLITIFTLLVIIITLGTFAVMLLIRYITLNLLLVLLPLAWVSWVFPLTKGNWDKWWREFLNQAFFAPIVVFFIWLVITTGKNMGNVSAETITVYDGSNPISSFLGSFIKGLIDPLAQGLVFAGLTVGGLIVSQSMSIKFAGAGVGAAQGMGKALGGYVGRRSAGFARGAAQKDIPLGGGRRIPSLQRGINALQTSRVPGFSALGRAGQTLIEKGGKNIIEAQATEAKSKDPVRIAKEVSGYMDMDKTLGYLKAAHEKDGVGFVKRVKGVALTDFLAQNEKAFEDRGMKKLHLDLQKAVGENSKVNAARKEVVTASQTEGGKKWRAAQNEVAAKEGVVQEARKKVGEKESAVRNAEKSGDAQAYIKIEREIAAARTKGDAAAVLQLSGQLSSVENTKDVQALATARMDLANAQQNVKGAENDRGKAQADLDQAALDKDAVALDGALKKLDEAAEEFAAGLKKSDVSDIELNTIFTKLTEDEARDPKKASEKSVFGMTTEEADIQREALARALAKKAPSLASNILPKLRQGDVMENFRDIYTTQIDIALARAVKEGKNKVVEDLTKSRKSFNTTYLNNALGYTGDGGKKLDEIAEAQQGI